VRHRALEKIGGFYVKPASKAIENVDADGVLTPLDVADLGPIDLGTMRKLFLRAILGASQPL
jgi:hypothetical protein